MTSEPTYDEIVNGADAEHATFKIGGWVGAVVTRDGQAWVATRAPGGAETVTPTNNLGTAVRHYTTMLHKATVHAEGSLGALSG